MKICIYNSKKIFSHLVISTPSSCIFTSKINMGRQRGQTSVEVRELVIKYYNDHKSVREIAKIINRPHSTVHDIIRRFNLSKSLENKPKSGRPKIFSSADERWIVHQIKKDPKLSAPKLTKQVSMELGKSVNPETIRLVLRRQNFHGRVPRKKPFISKRNRKKRLKFAKTYKSANLELWNKVIYSDESKFNLFRSDGQCYIWRQPNEELRKKNLQATVKHGGGSVMVWGCMSAAGPGKLCIIDGIMDQTKYLNILKQNLVQSAEQLGIRENFYFYQDNDPKHKAQNVRLWLLYNCPHVIDTPPQSPDLNVIEHLWAVLENKLKKHVISNKEQLERILKEEWAKIDPSVCRNLVESMPRRLLAVTKNKGLPTKY